MFAFSVNSCSESILHYALKVYILCRDRFHANDVDNEVIARNIVLLELISTVNPDDLSEVEYLWDIWYNMTLMKNHHEKLKVTLERLLDGSSSPRWRFGDRDTKKQVMATWKSWLEAEPWNVENVRRDREKISEFYCRLRSNTSRSNISTAPSVPFYKDVSICRLVMESDSSYCKHLSEWNQVQIVGVARDFVSGDSSSRTTDEVINPTMMRPGSSKWHVHYGSNPLEAYVPFER